MGHSIGKGIKAIGWNGQIVVLYKLNKIVILEGEKEMSTVTNHVLSQINEEGQQQGNDAYAFLTNILLCPFLYKQLEDEVILEKQTD